MFSLLYGFFKLYCGKEELRLLILGLDGAGKTVVFEQLKALYGGSSGPAPPGGLAAPRTTPTVGLNVGQLAAGHATVRLWDLGGLASLRSIWDKYYATAHGVVFVVDCAAPERLDEAKVALEGVVTSPDLRDAPILVLANKQDASHLPPPSPLSPAATPSSGAGGRGASGSSSSGTGSGGGAGRANGSGGLSGSLSGGGGVGGSGGGGSVVAPGALAEFLSPVLRRAADSRVQPAVGLRGEGLREGLTWLLAQLPRSPRLKRLRARERTTF